MTGLAPGPIRPPTNTPRLRGPASPQSDLEPSLHATGPMPAPHPYPDAPAGTARLWDRAAVSGLAVAGFLLSYDALRQMAAASHVRPLLTWLFPLIVDGFIAYGVRALLLMRQARPAARAYVWTLLAVATGASIWANVLHAVVLNQAAQNTQPSGQDSVTEVGLRLGNGVVGVLSAIAPLALAGAVHLHTLIHRPAAEAERGTPTDQITAGEPTVVQASEAPIRTRSATAVPDTGVPDRNSGQATGPKQPDTGHDTVSGSTGPTVSESAASSHPTGGRRSADSPLRATPSAPPGNPADVPTTRGRRPAAEDAVLLQIARTAATDRPTRAVVRKAIRAQGLTIGNDRLTRLMDQLRAETAHATHTA